MTFLLHFVDDDIAVFPQHIWMMRALDETDVDPRSGRLRSDIPTNALTEILLARDTRIYVSMPFPEVIRTYQLWVQQEKAS